MLDYYSLDAILIDEQPVAVQLRTAAYRLRSCFPSAVSTVVTAPGTAGAAAAGAAGSVPGAGGGADLPKGAVVDLPLWVARSLQQARTVDVKFPQTLAPDALVHFKSDANAPSLKERGTPYLLEVGARVAPLLRAADDRRRAVAAALDLHLRRYRQVVVGAHRKGPDQAAVRDKLGAAELARLHAVAADLQHRALWQGRAR